MASHWLSRVLDPEKQAGSIGQTEDLSRCHFALDKDSRDTREMQPAEKGAVVEIPKVGGLHHRYERRAA